MGYCADGRFLIAPISRCYGSTTISQSMVPNDWVSEQPELRQLYAQVLAQLWIGSSSRR